MTGLPTLEAARLKQSDSHIIGALGNLVDIIERTMLEVAERNGLQTALAEIRRQRVKQ